jgi:hypothetical protein
MFVLSFVLETTRQQPEYDTKQVLLLLLREGTLEITRVTAGRLGLSNLDLNALNFGRQLKNLVLDLANLKSSGWKMC